MKFYITTAIDYVNASPHIGHALEKIQADVLARYHLLRGDEVFYLTGADEHGAKIARVAEAAGKEPQKFVDESVKGFMALKGALNLAWDYFIRTSDQKRHWPGVRLMWEKLVSAGDIYKKTYKGLYCVGHEAFVTRKDLVDGKCADHGAEPEIIEEENYFFRLSKYGKEIESRIKNGELRIIPESRQNEILALIERGLEDVSFSRPRKDLAWGIPVPGDDSQTIYVWCDALTNYLSAIGFGQEDKWLMANGKGFEYWWPADVHVIGKDILRFHAAIWPGMLLSVGLELPKALFVHGFVTVNGQKISKTVGNVVDPHAMSKKYGIDALRYYLLRDIPSYDDGDFSESRLIARYNGDLANGLGNFAARVLALALGDAKLSILRSSATAEDGRIHAPPEASLAEGGNAAKIDKEIGEKIEKIKKEVVEKTEEFKFHEALAAIWELIAFGDQYVNEKKPWEKLQSADSQSQIVFNLVVILNNVAALLAPFLPETAEKITKSIVWEGDRLRVKKIKPLFPRILFAETGNFNLKGQDAKLKVRRKIE